MTTPGTTHLDPSFAEQRIPRDGHQLYARDYSGNEPAFVLMHGFPDNLGIYSRLAPILAEGGQRVIAFDFLGYGGSDKPTNYPYSATNMEDDLDAVVTSFQLRRIIPVAHDASGPTAINWSLDHGDRVASLVLLNTYYDAAPTCKFPEFISLFADPTYQALTTAIISDPAQFSWLLTFQAQQFRRDAPAAMQEGMQSFLAPIIRDQFESSPSAGPAFVSLTRGLHSSVQANTRRLPNLSTFQRPVKLIWGAGDPYLNVGVAEHLKESFPNADLSLLKLGHWPQIDGPEEVARLMLAFAAEVSG